jgi:hypothetical protein
MGRGRTSDRSGGTALGDGAKNSGGCGTPTLIARRQAGSRAKQKERIAGEIETVGCPVGRRPACAPDSLGPGLACRAGRACLRVAAPGAHRSRREKGPRAIFSGNGDLRRSRESRTAAHRKAGLLMRARGGRFFPWKLPLSSSSRLVRRTTNCGPRQFVSENLELRYVAFRDSPICRAVEGEGAAKSEKRRIQIFRVETH